MTVRQVNDATTGDLAQTFYIDSAAVNNATQVFLSSVDLYFYTKPYDAKLSTSSTQSTSQLTSPGVTVYIVPTKIENQIHVPDLSKRMRFGRARLEYDQILTSVDASVGTKFSFKYPVPLSTQTNYAFIIKFDGNDNVFSLFRNKAGETTSETTNTTTAAVARGAYDGYFFYLTNGLLSTPNADIDLKFKVNITKFDTTPKTISAVNRNFEIIVYDSENLTGKFIGGEYVFANTGFPAGQTISTSIQSNTVTGSGTKFLSDFAVNDLIVLNSGSTNVVRKITSITSDTVLDIDFKPAFTNTVAKYVRAPIAKIWDFSPSTNTLVLISSTANDTFNFIPNTSSNTLVGVVSGAQVTARDLSQFTLDVFTPDFTVDVPPGTSVNTFVKLANTTYDTIDESFNLTLYTQHMFTKFPATMHSRSNEIAYGSETLLNDKSTNFIMSIDTDNEFTTPVIEEEGLTFLAYRRIINNDDNNEHIHNAGNAYSKYISKKVVVDQAKSGLPEDMIVYLDAYRPFGSDIQVYCKFHNNSDPEQFDTKHWTKLESVSPTVLYSSIDNKQDIVTLEYRLPYFPVYDSTVLNAGPRLTGKFTCDDESDVFYSAESTVVNTEVANNDVVRIYDPLSPNNSLVAVVTSTNSTSFSIDRTITTSNTAYAPFVTPGLNVEKVTYKNSSFKDVTRSGVLRYYNYQQSAMDGYHSYQFKIVMLADSTNLSPIIYNLRGIACSA